VIRLFYNFPRHISEYSSGLEMKIAVKGEEVDEELAQIDLTNLLGDAHIL
jgi:hypothetical protein